VFPIPEEHLGLYENQTVLPIEFPDGTTPVCSRVIVYDGNEDWKTAKAPLIPSMFANELPTIPKDVIFPTLVDAYPKKGIDIVFPSTKNNSNVKIRFGETLSQDLIAEIGAPDAVFRKREDKMKIHSIETNGTEDEEKAAYADDYFFNYYRYGIDFLLDGMQHFVVKIILHGNFPGHRDFDRYYKCPYRITIGEESKKAITADSKWKAAEQILGSFKEREILFNRPNPRDPFGPTRLRGYGEQRAIFEVLPTGHISQITLF